jgi:hypothetical protein
MLVGARLRISMSLRQAMTCARATVRIGAVIFQVGEGNEFRDIDLIGAPRFRIGDAGEPFELRRYIRKIAVLFWRERPFAIDSY